MNFSDWTVYNKGIICKRAPHVTIEINKKELFKHFQGCYYIRYASKFDNVKSGDFYYVVRNGVISIDTLPTKTRNMVRKCLKSCIIKEVTVDEIKLQGYNIYLKECMRYHSKGFKYNIKSRDEFSEGLKKSNVQGDKYWGVYIGQTLIAYCVINIIDDVVNLVTWKADYESYNLLYPVYGLIFEICNHYLRLPEIRYINDGNRSFTEHSEVQKFLIERFMFKKVYANLNVHFKWYVKIPVLLISSFEKFITNKQLLAIIRMYKWSQA